jgi:hypothetical protein
MIFDREKADDIFRQHILDALDKAAIEVFGAWSNSHAPGASDADLPHIFPMVDKQIDRLAARYEHEFTDDAGKVRGMETEARAFVALSQWQANGGVK